MLLDSHRLLLLNLLPNRLSILPTRSLSTQTATPPKNQIDGKRNLTFMVQHFLIALEDVGVVMSIAFAFGWYHYGEFIESLVSNG